MRKYLLAAVIVAALSLVLTLLSLASLYGYNPFALSLVKQFDEVKTLADASAYVQAVSAVATAIATIFALIVGAIAIIAVIESEKSEHKSVEQIKVDFASLGSLLLSLRNRVFLYTNTSVIDLDSDIFQDERQKLVSIMTSPTGLAIYLWSGDKNRMTQNDVFSELCGLIDCLTLKLESGTIQGVLNLVAQRASEIVQNLSKVTEAQFKQMSKPLARLGDGLEHAARAVQSDPFAELQRDIDARRLAQFRAPTQQEVEALMQLAASKIGGQADKTVEHFGKEAMRGSDQDRANFHRLVRQLFKIDLDDLKDEPRESS